jgi:hypothetical protein
MSLQDYYLFICLFVCLFVYLFYLLIVNRTVDNRDLKKRGGKKKNNIIYYALLQLHRSLSLLGFAPSRFPRYNSPCTQRRQPERRTACPCMHARATQGRTDQRITIVFCRGRKLQ